MSRTEELDLPIMRADLLDALEKVKVSVDEKEILKHEEWRDNFQSV